MASASTKVVGSATVGPEPITLGSSAIGPCTSEIASVRLRRASAPRRPPFTADRCFLTQLSPSMATPARINVRAVASMSSSADARRRAPPETPTRLPTAARPGRRYRPSSCASSSARTPAATLAALGSGCPPSKPLEPRRELPATDARARHHHAARPGLSPSGRETPRTSARPPCPRRRRASGPATELEYGGSPRGRLEERARVRWRRAPR